MTRLPLQTGAESRGAWMQTLLGLPGVLLLAWGAALIVVDYGWAGILLSLLGAGLVIDAALFVGKAVARRASDVVIDDRGFAIDGGPAHGLQVPWSELEAGSVKAVTRDGGATALILDAPRLGQHTLAQSGDADEALSLRNLAAALDSSRPGASPASPELPTEAPTCASCGAPVAPTSEPTVACGHCGHTSETPPAVRARMRGQRDHAAAAKESSALVAELLAQPTARTANARMAIMAVLSAWVVIAFMAGELFLLVIGVAEAFTFGTSAVFSLLLVFLVSVMTTRRFVDRHALQSLLAVFGAHPPRRTGEPWGCRGCGAPLPADTAALVRCAFCGRDNVTGADLRPGAAELQRETSRLERVLEQRRSRQRRGIFWFWVLTPGVVLCGLVAAFLIALGVEFVAEHDNCEGGEARACVSLAFTYSDEANLRRDLAKAARFAERGCVLGDDTGCCIARTAIGEHWGPFADERALSRRLAIRASVLDTDCW